MDKNQIIEILCKRLGQISVVEEIDYGRIEELCFLIQMILKHKSEI